MSRLVVDTLESIWGDNEALSKYTKDLKDYSGDAIKLPIHSGGGNVFEGLAIYNLFKGHKAQVETHIIGLAASMATIVALSGDVVKMSKQSYFMIHDPSAGTFGNIEDHEANLELLQMMKSQLQEVYVNKTGLSSEVISDMMREETWMTAQEALEKGFVDELTEGADIQASVDLSAFMNVPKKVLDVFGNDSNKIGKKADRKSNSANNNQKSKVVKGFESFKNFFFGTENPEDVTVTQMKENFMATMGEDIQLMITETSNKVEAKLQKVIDAQALTIKELEAKVTDESLTEIVSGLVPTAVEAAMEKGEEELEAKLTEVNNSVSEVEKAVAKMAGKTDAEIADMKGLEGLNLHKDVKPELDFDAEEFEKLGKNPV